jgi:hypothetical protein
VRNARRPAIHEEASVKTGARRARDFPDIHSAAQAVEEEAWTAFATQAGDVPDKLTRPSSAAKSWA